MSAKTWEVRHSRVWEFTVEADTRAEALVIALATLNKPQPPPSVSTTVAIDWKPA